MREPWPEGRDWREVATSEARLPLLLAVDQHERSPDPVDTWVPGMPFAAAEPKAAKRRSAKKKNRP